MLEDLGTRTDRSAFSHRSPTPACETTPTPSRSP
jgi:hypothetical protein